MRGTAYPDFAERRRQAHDEYLLGLEFYKKRQWKAAARHFSLAELKSSYDDTFMHLYMSYQGLCQLLGGDISGLNLCRHAASMETIQATVFQNLALAEMRLKHRKRACSAVKFGLDIDPHNSALIRMRQKMGLRRPPCVKFLKRNHLLNKWLGRLTYQRLSAAH